MCFSARSNHWMWCRNRPLHVALEIHSVPWDPQKAELAGVPVDSAGPVAYNDVQRARAGGRVRRKVFQRRTHEVERVSRVCDDEGKPLEGEREQAVEGHAGGRGLEPLQGMPMRERSGL